STVAGDIVWGIVVDIAGESTGGGSPHHHGFVTIASPPRDGETPEVSQPSGVAPTVGWRELPACRAAPHGGAAGRDGLEPRLEPRLQGFGQLRVPELAAAVLPGGNRPPGVLDDRLGLGRVVVIL